MAEGQPGSSPIPVRVFISYRREDTRGYAGRLYDSLLQRLAPGQVFMDIDDIAPGVDFVDVLTETVQRADVELVLIGPQWLDVRNARGQRRLDDPNDYVRMETEEALRRGIRVIPLLFGGAVMPGSDELPESLAPLSRRNALEISDGRWRFDIGRLLDAIEAVGRAQADAAQKTPEQQTHVATEPDPAVVPPAVRVAEPKSAAPESAVPESAPEPKPVETPAEVAPVEEPVPLMTEPAPASSASPPGGNRRRILIGGGAVGGAAAVVVAVIAFNGGSPSPSPSPTATAGGSENTGAASPVLEPITVTIAVDMPSQALADRMGLAVELAILEREQELSDAGYIVEVAWSAHTVDVARANAEQIVADASVVAMVGPRNKAPAAEQIPVTNPVGLPQCGPGTGHPPLTREDAGALELRAARPDQPNFFRPIARDDLEGSAAAEYALQELDVGTAFVVTDTSEFGDYVSSGFAYAFAEGGGAMPPRHDVEPDPNRTDYSAIMSLIGEAEVVFLGTDNTPITANFRRAMVTAGLGDIPLLAGSSIVHPLGAEAESYFELAGEAAADTFAAAGGPFEPPGMAAFVAAFQAAYPGRTADWELAIGYTCGQVVAQSLINTSPSVGDLREALRAEIIGSGTTFETVLGPMSFDAEGDTLQPVTRILSIDPSGDGGRGAWVLAVEIPNPTQADLTHAREGTLSR